MTSIMISSIGSSDKNHKHADDVVELGSIYGLYFSCLSHARS